METTIAPRRPARVRARGRLPVLVLFALVPALLGPLAPGAAAAQETVEEDGNELVEGAPSAVGAEVPSYGAARPGPVRPERDQDEETAADVDAPAVDIDSTPIDDDSAAAEGVVPVAIQIDVMGVDAYVERAPIDETGTMQDPSGPWVVAWYEDLAAVGEGSNVVLAGHVDYWNTEGGEAVFSALKWQPEILAEGELIEVYGEDDEVYEYQVTSNKLYDMQSDMTPEVIRDEIVGPTDEETLTIITCGGDFNYDTGEYYSRRVIRAKPV